MSLPSPNGETQFGLNVDVDHPIHGQGTVKAMSADGRCSIVWADGSRHIDVPVAELTSIADAQSAADAEFERLNAWHRKVNVKADELKVLEAARAQIRAEKAADLDFTGQYLTRKQLLDLPAPEPLIEHVLPRHAYAILRGRDHSFKSFAAIDWACCLATGKPWQGHHAEQTRVLYVAGEGAHGLARRIAAWEYAWGREIPDERLTVRRTALNMHTPGPAFDDLLDHVTTGGYGLVIIDTLRRVSGSADGNSSEMGAVVDNLDRIKQATDAGTVLAVAHTDKGDHDTRGYSGIEDDADVVWAAKRDEMHLTLELTKMKDGPDGRTIHLLAERTDAGSLILTGITGTPSPDTTESQLKILDTIRELFPDGVSSSVLLKTTGLADATFYRAMKQLREHGVIQNLGKGKATHFVLAEELLSPPEETDQSDTGTSHDLPSADTPSDLHNSHTSHDLSTDLPLPLTPLTTLRSERTESESGSNTTEEPR